MPQPISVLDNYKLEVSKIRGFAATRMGHPYTGHTPVCEPSQDQLEEKLIDNSVLGVKPGSIADTYINNVGSPYSRSKYIQRDVKGIELDAIKRVIHHLGANEPMRGYITAGATEASLACLWWLRNELRNHSKNLFMLASESSHSSVFKVANILDIKCVKVPSDNFGKVEVNSLLDKINEINTAYEKVAFIISLNIGTTELGGIDDILSITSEINILQKKEEFICRYHVDAALLGLAIPIFRYVGDQSILDLVDTFVFSGHKLLGTISISGMALAKSYIWEKAFKNLDISIPYIEGIQDTTALGSRAGYNVIEFHYALCSLDIGELKPSRLTATLLRYNRNAQFLALKLRELVGKNFVIHQENQFVVVFPFPEKQENTILPFLQKYGLMKVNNNRLGICVLANVTKNLIEDFIKDYKLALGNQ